MITGDTHINADAPIICCTAEILANQALREGHHADVGCVAMDEFHYYGDPERGWAWQVPLLTLPDTQFLLMSATLGNVDAIADKLEDMTDTDVDIIADAPRPVPLTYEYTLDPLEKTVELAFGKGETPIYVVHFSQDAALETANAAGQHGRVQQGAARRDRGSHQGHEVHHRVSARSCSVCCVPASASTMPACSPAIVVWWSSSPSRDCCQ